MNATTLAIVAAMVLAIVYNSIGWDKPTTGMQSVVVGDSIQVNKDNALAITVVVLNAIVGIIVLGHIVGVSFNMQSGAIDVSMGIPLVGLFLLATIGVNIADATTVREKRGDALGMASSVMSGLSILPVVLMIVMSMKSGLAK